MAESLRKKIKSIRSFSEQKVALILAQEGKLMNEEIYSHVEELITEYPKAPLFTLSIIESLIWAKYSKPNKQFFELSLDYFIKGDKRIFEKTGELAWRFGPEKLNTVIKSWKTLLDELEISKLSHLFSLNQLLSFQEDALDRADSLCKTRMIPQIGPWIFCGPFKILAAYRKDLWNNSDLDKIRMPLGFQVIRGLRFLKLILKQIDYKIPLELLNEEEPSLCEGGMGTVVIAQNFQRNLAILVGSRVLHINSGLFKLGEEKVKNSE